MWSAREKFDSFNSKSTLAMCDAERRARKRCRRKARRPQLRRSPSAARPPTSRSASPWSCCRTCHFRSAQATGDNSGSALDLPWRRCLPGGCFADALAADDVLKRWRGLTEPGRIVLKSASGREVALPLSFRGLAPALDALAKERAWAASALTIRKKTSNEQWRAPTLHCSVLKLLGQQ